MPNEGSSPDPTQNSENQNQSTSSASNRAKAPSVDIEDAYQFLDSQPPPHLLRPSPAEIRRNKKLAAAGRLSMGLWLLLGLITSTHMIAVIIFSGSMAWSEDTESAKTEQVKEAINQVNETAKTLYAFIGPLVAAVTGYYFSSTEGDRTDR